MKKKLDERDEKARQNGEMTCNDLILTNFHVIQDATNKMQQTKHADISAIKKEFAPERSGRDILLATGNPSAIRKSCAIRTK